MKSNQIKLLIGLLIIIGLMIFFSNTPVNQIKENLYAIPVKISSFFSWKQQTITTNAEGVYVFRYPPDWIVEKSTVSEGIYIIGPKSKAQDIEAYAKRGFPPGEGAYSIFGVFNGDLPLQSLPQNKQAPTDNIIPGLKNTYAYDRSPDLSRSQEQIVGLYTNGLNKDHVEFFCTYPTWNLNDIANCHVLISSLSVRK